MRKLAFIVFCLTAFAGSALADKTERTWQAKCASCHGDDGKGQTAKGKETGARDMTTAEYQKASDAQLQKAIEDGVDRTVDGKKLKMDGYKDKLKPDQIAELVKYIRGFAGK